VGLTTGLDGMEKKLILNFIGTRTPARPLVIQPAASRYTDWTKFMMEKALFAYYPNYDILVILIECSEDHWWVTEIHVSLIRLFLFNCVQNFV
jgi:hypothetical protein